MATMAKQRKSHVNIRPPPKYQKAKLDYEIEEDEDSSTSSQTPSIDRTRDLPNSIDEDKLRNWEGKILGSASGVFTFKVSLPALMLAIAVGYYIKIVENHYEHKFEELMQYGDNLKKIKTLSEKVPSLEDRLSKFQEGLIQIDERVIGMQREIRTANDKLTNVESRVSSISDTSSKLEHDLPIQRKRFDEMEYKLNKMGINISDISKNITSFEDQLNAVKEQITMTEKNQTSLKGLLNITVEKAENVHKHVSKIQNMYSEIQVHLPIIEKINKSVTVIMTIHQHLPQLQRRLRGNKIRIHGLELEVNNTEPRFNALKLTSESVGKTVNHVRDTLTDIETKVKLSQDDLFQLKQGMSNTGNIFKNRLTKLEEDLETSNGKILKRTSQLDTDISSTEVKIGTMIVKVDDYMGKLGKFESYVDSLSADVNKMKPIVDYADLKLPELDIDVRNLQSQNTGLFEPINVCVALAFILIAVLFYLIYFRYENDGTQFREHQRTESHSTPPFISQRAPSILDRIHRVPVFENKVCVLSFYSETMNLHKQLVKSALASSRRGNNIEVIQHLVRRHEDISSIPPARYIFVFVDFNERNVILENPGQDLGDKKLVTVQAAQKIGADVFVTYVRDRGSNQLVPGNLYNQELSAFTSHHVLRTLENKQRCFSVYETFNNTQKDSIVRSIS
ncbi:uncharacterized protein LOC134721060 [Mytilus trossulus]|uniref:uncharacterized protein LOC134721060 n=1 Tax=Mytilus trossulus TaxID=6551 RepID=UPI003005EF32